MEYMGACMGRGAYAKGNMGAWGHMGRDAKDNTGAWKVRERNPQRKSLLRSPTLSHPSMQVLDAGQRKVLAKKAANRH